MSVFFMHISMFFISVATVFVPQKEYKAKVELAKVEVAKVELAKIEVAKPLVLEGWVEDSLKSSELNITHIFLRHPNSGGSDKTVLFIHGLNFTPHVFQKLSPISQNAELISYQLPEDTELYTGKIEDYTKIIDDLLRELKLDSVTLCGTSFGGQIVANYAANGKTPANALILISTKFSGATRKDKKQMESLNRLVKRKNDYQIYWIMEKLIDKFRKSLTPEEVAEISPMLKIRQIPFYRQTTYSMFNYQTQKDVEKLNIPIVLINGSEDHLISKKDMEIFKNRIPKAKIHITKGGTHAITWTESEEISKIILNTIEFLQNSN